MAGAKSKGMAERQPVLLHQDLEAVQRSASRAVGGQTTDNQLNPCRTCEVTDTQWYREMCNGAAGRVTGRRGYRVTVGKLDSTRARKTTEYV